MTVATNMPLLTDLGKYFMTVVTNMPLLTDLGKYLRDRPGIEGSIGSVGAKCL
ncbi:MAG: hypothetical protein ABI878_06245 [Acidobacteriota bacterium]